MFESCPRLMNFDILITAKRESGNGRITREGWGSKVSPLSHSFTGFNIAAYVLLQIEHIVTSSCWVKDALTGG